MNKMKYSWQLNVFVIVLLISLCSGGPVKPQLNNTLSDSEDSSKNNDLSLVSKTGEGTITGTNKLPAETTKVDEAKAVSAEPGVGTKSVTNISSKANIITNYNIVKMNSTVIAGKENASSPVEEINPPAPESTLVDASSSDNSAADQVKSEGDNQQVVDKENDTKATNNEGTLSDNAEIENKDEERKDTPSETVLKVSTKIPEPVLPEKNEVEVTEAEQSADSQTVDKPSETEQSADSQTVDKPSETVLKVSTKIPEPALPDKKEAAGTEAELSADSQTVKEEPTADSEGNTQTEDQESSEDLVSNTKTEEASADLVSNTETEKQGTSADDSESNTATDNQDPSSDVSNKSPADVSVSKSSSTTKTTTTTTSSSFDIYIGGDSSATYPQSGDQDFSSFNGYNGNDNGPSYDDEVGMNSVDNAPYDNERGAYKNEQQKLNGEFTDDTDSHFFAYFLTIMVSAVVFYLLFHNKQRVGQALGCVKKNERLRKIKEDKSKEPLLKSSSGTDG